MRRSICICEPSVAYAGEKRSWQFLYTTATALPKGTKLKFDMASHGREIDWQTPSSSSKATENAIYCVLPNHKVIYAKAIELDDEPVPFFEFSLPQAINVGQQFIIVIGTPPKGGKGKGTRAQQTAERRRSFLLYVDTSGKGIYDEPETFTLDVRGGEVTFIRILTPSFVLKNRRFDVVVRFEDAYGNLSSHAPEETLLELSYEHIRDNLNWKIFIPETGFIALPNLYFNEPGIYTIALNNTKTKEVFRSSPIKCWAENATQLFWGLLHGESERFDSTENIENCLRHMRDDRALNFFSSSPFENLEETSVDTWKNVSHYLTEFSEEDRFITFFGQQWQGAESEEGLRHLLMAKEGKPLLRRKDPKYSSLTKLYHGFHPKELIAIPCFTMGSRSTYDFTAFDPDYERVVEIYNAWGSSECTEKEGNLRPIRSNSRNGVHAAPEGALRKALDANCRFGFVAGGLDDRGAYGGYFEGDQEQYSPGLTAILAKEHSRPALFEALYNRACYATTGARIILTFYLSGAVMGNEVQTADKPGFLVNRHISGSVAGTCKLHTVEIIRNGDVIHTFHPKEYWMDYEYDDLDPLKSITRAAKANKPPFVYYYIRVTQEDGHIAWSSPIWVDLVPPVPGRGRKLLSKSAKKPFAILEEDVEDEIETDVVDDLTDND